MIRYESDKTAIGSIHWKLQSVDERKQRKSKDMKRKGLPWWSSDLGSALQCKDFPGGSDGKASVYNSGDPGSIPRSGRSPGEGNGNPLQYCCLENPMDRGACRLQSMRSQRVRHDWVNSLHFTSWRNQRDVHLSWEDLWESLWEKKHNIFWGVSLGYFFKSW